MRFCKDQATDMLADYGFNVVRIPREGINPLDVIGRDGDQMRLGTINQLIGKVSDGLPTITIDHQTSGINGASTSKMNLSLGLEMLGNILGSMANANIDLGAAYKRASKIQFKFENVTSDQVAPFTIGEYLKNATIDTENPVLKRYVEGKGKLYLITKTIKSNSLIVISETSDGSDLSLSVPAVAQIAKATLSVDTEAASRGQIRFSGEQRLIFGFKAYEINVKGGKLELKAATPGSVAMSADPEVSAIASGQPLIDFEDVPL